MIGKISSFGYAIEGLCWCMLAKIFFYQGRLDECQVLAPLDSGLATPLVLSLKHSRPEKRGLGRRVCFRAPMTGNRPGGGGPIVFDFLKAWSNEDESGWESISTLALVWPPTLINSHALSCTLMHSHQLWAGSNFGESQWEVWLVWPVMRVARESLRVAEASDFQVITHKKKKEKRKYYYVSSTSDSWSNDSDCQQFDKRQKTKKKSGEATSKNKEIEKRRKTLVNSHATLTARLTEQWELRKHSCKLSPANSRRLSYPRLILA